MSLLPESTSDKRDEPNLTKEALRPLNKVESKLDKEMQELKVESTKGGANGG